MKKETKQKIKTFFKGVALVLYSCFWFLAIFITFGFSLVFMRPPWKLFTFHKRDYDDKEEHNWDPDYTDLEYYDMVDDE